MPYNTTAIPPKKEPTGQTQLPLSRVKKIISQDSDVQMCSNNAAFIITCAAELFIQHLADEAHNQARAERKPRRNIQYKDMASAIAHHDHLEFLEDVVPKTVPYKKIKAAAGHTQARLRAETAIAGGEEASASSTPAAPVNKKSGGGGGSGSGSKPNGNSAKAVNGEGSSAAFFSLTTSRLAHNNNSHNSSHSHGPSHGRSNVTPSSASAPPEEDPSQQLELEMRQAQAPDRDADVQMTG